jgi:hypothetical protein
MEIFELENGVRQCNAFMTFTLGIIVLFVGKRLNGLLVPFFFCQFLGVRRCVHA